MKKPFKKEFHIFALVAAAAAAIAVKGMSQRKSYKIAMIDSLTGIGDDDYYTRVLTSVITPSKRRKYYVAYLSLNSSKEKNLLSETEIEDVQKYAAKQLTAMATPTEYVARIADGIFAFVYPADNEEEAKERIEEILKALKEYLGGFHEEYSRLFGAGICSLADYPTSAPDQVLKAAKQGYIYAMRSRTPYVFATNEVIENNAEYEKLRLGITRAIKNDEFEIYLQFIVDRVHEKICGAEVLSRWDNPEFGLMRPAKYIEIMLTTGAVTKHDYAIFEKLCALLESLQKSGYGSLFLTSNFTRISASEEDFAEKIKEISDKYTFDHSKLIIELTEDSLSEDNRVVTASLKKCKAMGFKIAIDDMGSGFSAISDLYTNEIDLVKIGRAHV